MRKINIYTFIVAIMIVSPAFGQNEDIKARIIKVNQEMAKAMMEGNTEKSLSFYAEDAISMPNNAAMLEGIAAIRKSTEEMSSMGMKVKSFEVQTLYTVPCENMIVEIGKFNIRFSIPGSEEVNQDGGKYLTIWEQQPDGSLKIKLETWNSDTNPVMNTGISEKP